MGVIKCVVEKIKYLCRPEPEMVDAERLMQDAETFANILRGKHLALTPDQFLYFVKRACAYQLNTPESIEEAHRFRAQMTEGEGGLKVVEAENT